MTFARGERQFRPTIARNFVASITWSTLPKIEGDPTPEEQRALDGIEYYQRWDSGYSKEQATRPQTVGYGLNDSPAAQAAWILEKFWAWTDCEGDPESVLTRDELLDNVMLYWATESGASSARIYWQSFGKVERQAVTIPTGVAVYPKEIVPPVRHWMEAGDYPNIQYWEEMTKGGHFAAFEQPECFVNNVRAFFKLIR